MGKNNVADLLSVDSLFTTQAEREEAQRETVVDIPLSEISDFPNHPFQVRMDENMMEMAESVRQYGVLVPALVRPKAEGGYEMVAGHRRKMASKMKLDAMKRQGQRTDLTLSPVATKLDSATELGKQSGESRDQVFRHIRLTKLIPEILELVDNSVLKEKGILQMAMRPAVELSYLTKNEQYSLLETMESEDCTPSHEQAIKLRKFSKEEKLHPDVILSILQEEKPNQVEQFRMPRDRISKYFAPGTPAQRIEDTIIKALELYRKRQREQER
ncbi:ParB/RepB/Spo0J family partition protein [Faecalicatena orotica]|uniref:ParB/RepB/Spo0J family partition protein n=1 Tax=Faecalicatena orotica TaxID=1544 RepID=UPI003217D0FA